MYRRRASQTPSPEREWKSPSAFFDEDTMEYQPTRRPIDPDEYRRPSTERRSSFHRPALEIRRPSLSPPRSPRGALSFLSSPRPRRESSSRLRSSSMERGDLDDFLRDAPPDDFVRHDPHRQRESSLGRRSRLILAENRYRQERDGLSWRSPSPERGRSPMREPLTLRGGISGRDELPDYDRPGPVWVQNPQRYHGDPDRLVRSSSYGEHNPAPPSYPQGLPAYLDDEPSDRHRSTRRGRGSSLFGWR